MSPLNISQMPKNNVFERLYTKQMTSSGNISDKIMEKNHEFKHQQRDYKTLANVADPIADSTNRIVLDDTTLHQINTM